MLIGVLIVIAFATGAPTIGAVESTGERFTVSQPHQGAQDDATKQSLYNRWHDNYRTDQKVAYDAASEYLRRFPYDASENAQLMRKWMAAYERVITNTPAATIRPTSSTDPSASASQHFTRGAAHAKIREWREAEAEFKAALALEPSSVEYRGALGDAFRQQDKWSEAEVQYRQLASASLESYDYRRYLADSLLHLNRWTEAEAEYRKALLLRKDNEEVSAGLSQALLMQQKLEEAESIVTRLVLQRWGADKPDAELLALQGAVFFAQGKVDEARDSYLYAVGSAFKDPKYRSLLEEFAAKTRSSQIDLVDTYWNHFSHLLHLTDSGHVEDGTNKSEDSLYTVTVTRSGTWQKKGAVIYLEGVGVSRGYWYVGLIGENKIRLLSVLPNSGTPGGSAPIGFNDLDRFNPGISGSGGIEILASYGKIILTEGMPARAELVFRQALAIDGGKPHYGNARAYAGLAIALASQAKWKDAERAMQLAADGVFWRHRERFKDAVKEIRARTIPDISSHY